MRVLFYGSDRFSTLVLDNFLENTSKRICASVDVCVPNLICTRKNKVKMFNDFVTSRGLRNFSWLQLKQSFASDTLSLDTERYFYDFGVVASFGKMIPTPMITSFRKGMLNVHPSLLPQYRGASPLVYALLNDDPFTGVTITDISPEKMDRGRIYLQKKLSIPQEYTFTELRDDAAKLGGSLLAQVISDFDYFEKITTSQHQKPSVCQSELIWARKIKKNDCFISWNCDSAAAIFRKYRAFKELFGLRTFFKGSEVLLLDVSLQSSWPTSLGKVPGMFTVNHEKTHIFIRCQNGEVISVQKLQLSSHKPLSAREFFTGYIRSFCECRFSDYA